MHTHENILQDYKYSDSQIWQEHFRSEADKVQNGGVSRNNYRNNKEEMEQVLASRN